ncbi:MAG: GIY-YIG nuclease family protein [Patescibacteria group bacterium]
MRQRRVTWSVYILRCADRSLYTGISTDVETRVKRHNAGQGAAYTRSHRPVLLVWTEEAKSESDARKREAEIKRWTKTDKELFLTSRKKHFRRKSL